VYFFPSDADYVCEVNTITGQVRAVVVYDTHRSTDAFTLIVLIRYC
jgi:hypothetical protein